MPLKQARHKVKCLEQEIPKYAKLAVLATLNKPKSLSELGRLWYDENGRFYKKKAKQEISRGIKKGYLVREGKKYKANNEKILSKIYSKIKNKDLKEKIKDFWNHPFSQQTYLDSEAIKQLFSNNPEKACLTNLKLLFETPLMLHYLQEKDPEIYFLFISLQGLDDYTKIINTNSQENLNKTFKNLSQKVDWIDSLQKINKSSKLLECVSKKAANHKKNNKKK